MMSVKAAIDNLWMLLKKQIFCGVYGISWQYYLKSKNQKDFHNIMYYLLIERRNKYYINF